MHGGDTHKARLSLRGGDPSTAELHSCQRRKSWPALRDTQVLGYRELSKAWAQEKNPAFVNTNPQQTKNKPANSKGLDPNS